MVAVNGMIFNLLAVLINPLKLATTMDRLRQFVRIRQRLPVRNGFLKSMDKLVFFSSKLKKFLSNAGIKTQLIKFDVIHKNFSVNPMDIYQDCYQTNIQKVCCVY